MTSRERIIGALNFQKTDRVAIDLGGTNATGVNAVVYNKLKKLLKITSGEIKVYDVLGQLAEIEPEVLDIMGGDVVILRRLAPSIGLPVRAYKQGRLLDGTECLFPDTFKPVLDEKGDYVIYKENGNNDLVHPYKLHQEKEAEDHNIILARLPKGSHAFCRVYHPLEAVDKIEELLAADGTGAGAGDLVIAIPEGGSARMVCKAVNNLIPIDIAIAGIVDVYESEDGEIRFL
jgi:microcompartment protein CcmK/EutM